MADYCVLVLRHLDQVSEERASIAALQSTRSKSNEERDAYAQDQCILEEKDQLIDVLNKLYRLCASDPKLDAYTGRCEE